MPKPAAIGKKKVEPCEDLKSEDRNPKPERRPKP
jgi:hypothetical protein